MNSLPFEQRKVTIIVRKAATTDSKFGCFPDKRNIKDHLHLGVFNCDKPAGPTSHQVSAYVQKILSINKSGHSGTLDPQVTGVLPITLSKSTKIVQNLLKAGKEYVCLMHLHKKVREFELYRTVDSFVGEISQLPPIKSSVKRQWRKRSIYYIDIISVVDKDVLFLVGCQSGTYIRKLVHDIGQKLGCGAHMAELRRTKAGPFNESTLFTLQDLVDAFYYYKEENNEKFIRKVILPVEYAVSHLKKIWVFDTTVNSLCHGSNLALPGISKLEAGIVPGETVSLFTLKNELICYGTSILSSKDMLKEKGISVNVKKVIMNHGIYPRMNIM